MENNPGTKETHIDGLSKFFVRHDAIIKAHQDEIKVTWLTRGLQMSWEGRENGESKGSFVERPPRPSY